MRYIGVDLHTTQITVCYWQSEAPQETFAVYPLAQIAELTAGLQRTDALAVEATGNTRWFVGQVKGLVGEVVIVNPREFEVIKKSVKKTDKNDARQLARFLQAGLLPQVREKSEPAERVASLNETRSKLVRLKTSFLNKIHALAVSRGRKLKKESLGSEVGLERVLAMDWSAAERLELEIIADEIRHLRASIKRLDKVLAQEAEKLPGYRNLVSMTGLGPRSAGVLLSVIGGVEDFADADKLASYFGIVPRVSNSNESVKSGRITKRGHKTGRTTLVQCTLAALRHNDYLKKYYESVKARRGHGKAKIAAARKYLRLIYNVLSNNWVFADFNNFELAE
jgi:transposase